MISLSGEGQFCNLSVIQNQKINYFLGEWELINSKFEITKTSFICNIFNDDSYILIIHLKLLKMKLLYANHLFLMRKNISKTEYQTGIESVIKLCQHKIIKKCIISRIIKVNYK